MRTIRKLARLLLALCFGVLASFAVGTTGWAADSLRIPLMESFSGTGADWSADLWSGALVGQEMINARGGVKGRPLELYKEDAPFDALPEAVTTFRRLARDSKVPLIFDGGATSVIAAVHDLAEEHKVPLFAFTSGGAWRLPKFNPWVFRMLPTPEIALPVLWDKARQRWNFKSAALWYAIDDEKSVPNANVFKQLAKRDGVTVMDLRFKGKETDFSAQLTQVEAAKVDVHLITAQSWDAGLIVLQAREKGLTQPVLGDISLGGTPYNEFAKGKQGSLAQGNPTVFYDVFNPNDPRDFVQNALKAYQAKWGKPPSNVAVRGIEGVLALQQVLNRANTLDREGIRAAFATASGIETMSGLVHWEGSGDAKRKETLLLTWDAGKVIPIPDSFWKK